MDELALERVKERLRDAAEGKPAPAELEAALDRARLQVEALAQTADELQTALPDTVGVAVREGVRAEALPVARQLAEVRGLAAQTIRRLERLETDLIAERNARVDDLALLVDLISSGWQGVDARLRRIEQAVVPQDAQVIRLEDRAAR